jgi:hypothetical protein
MICIEKNLAHLGQILLTNDWGKLRRHPVCVVPDEAGEARLMNLALERIRSMSETYNGPREPGGPGTPRPAIGF